MRERSGRIVPVERDLYERFLSYIVGHWVKDGWTCKKTSDLFKLDVGQEEFDISVSVESIELWAVGNIEEVVF
mgnify:CR=1 FL=1